MRNHLISLGVGAATAIVGLVLWQFAEDVETPVVSLGKVGVVLLVLGVLELVVTAGALAHPSTRRREYPL